MDNAIITLSVTVLGAVGGLATWLIQRRVERMAAERLRKSALYESLLYAITELSSFGNGAPILVESQNAWLYASDEVLRAVNGYLTAVADERNPDSVTTQEQREK